MMSDIVIYEDGNLELKIGFDGETVWLQQSELVQLFDKDQSVISRHINNIFKDNEVDKKSNMQKMHIANSDKLVNFYSLDIVLAVGYRTNSSKAIKFRQWATSILKRYIEDGYAINTHKITEQRLVSLESDMATIKSHIEHNTLDAKQGIFYDGEIYDAYIFVSDLIRSAKNSIAIVDNYIDDSVLTLLSKNSIVKTTIYTKTITKQLKLDSEKYNAQYKNLELKKFDLSHDRFLIIDDDIYHIGASLKDLGKKWFAFSKFDVGVFEMLGRLK